MSNRFDLNGEEAEKNLIEKTGTTYDESASFPSYHRIINHMRNKNDFEF